MVEGLFTKVIHVCPGDHVFCGIVSVITERWVTHRHSNREDVFECLNGAVLGQSIGECSNTVCVSRQEPSGSYDSSSLQ